MAPLTDSEHADLQDDLVFTRILLGSLDPQDASYDTERRKFEAKISDIERRLEQDIVDNIIPDAGPSQSSLPASSQQSSQRSTWRGPVPGANGGANGPVLQDPQRTPRAPRVEIRRPSPTGWQPQFRPPQQFRPLPQEHTGQNASNPSYSAGTERKRPNPYDGGTYERLSKARRGSASPSGTSTPSTYDGSSPGNRGRTDNDGSSPGNRGRTDTDGSDGGPVDTMGVLTALRDANSVNEMSAQPERRPQLPAMPAAAPWSQVQANGINLNREHVTPHNRTTPRSPTLNLMAQLVGADTSWTPSQITQAYSQTIAANQSRLHDVGLQVPPPGPAASAPQAFGQPNQPSLGQQWHSVRDSRMYNQQNMGNHPNIARMSSMPNIKSEAGPVAGPPGGSQYRSSSTTPHQRARVAEVVDLTGDSEDDYSAFRRDHVRNLEVEQRARRMGVERARMEAVDRARMEALQRARTNDGFDTPPYGYPSSYTPPYAAPGPARAMTIGSRYPSFKYHALQYEQSPLPVASYQPGILQRGADSFRGMVNDAASMIGGIFKGSYSDSESDDPYGRYDFSEYSRYQNGDVRRVLDQYNEHGGDPEEVKKQINDLLKNIAREDDTPREKRHPTPRQLAVELKEHQKIGLSWMKSMEDGSNKGGILADDMGLGKTIQALALILERPSDDPRVKTTLIVAPVALMRQWAEEIEAKVKPEHHLKVHIYHGPAKKHDFDFLRKFDVVLTTYGTVGSEWKKKDRWKITKEANPNAIRGRMDQFPLVDQKSMWHRVILDEAQCIKNPDTNAAHAAVELQAKTRFCMTGTPMMNGAHELFSLIQFLQIKPYCFRAKFNRDIGTPLKKSNHPQFESAMMRLRAVLAACMLRREKTSTIDGRPIISIPPKITVVNHVVFSPDERELYDTVAQRAQVRVSRFMKSGTVMKNYAEILVMLLRLRQACCHPHLTMDFSDGAAEGGPVGDSSSDDMKNTAKLFSQDVVARIKAAGEVFECPICYDGAENPVFFHPCGHDVCTECFGRITDPMRGIAEGREDGGGAKCPECRCAVSAKRVCDFRSFSSVHMPELLKGKGVHGDKEDEEDDDDDGDDGEEDDDDDEEGGESDGDTIGSETDDEEEDVGDETLGGFIVADDADDSEAEENGAAGVKNEEETTEEEDVKSLEEYSPNNPLFIGTSARRTRSQGDLRSSDQADSKREAAADGKDKGKGKAKAGLADMVRGKGKPGRKRKKKGKCKGKGKKKRAKDPSSPRKTLAQLRAAAHRSAATKRTYLRRLARFYEPSAKLTACVSLLERIRAEHPGEKVLVFSQFTTFLDLIEVPLSNSAHRITSTVTNPSSSAGVGAATASGSGSDPGTATRTSFGPQAYERYDGSMSARTRAAALTRFRTDAACTVLLMSLKAGNAGLNLSCASHVVMLDPFWNPYVEAQAVDRAHRYPQEREVRVHRLLVGDTVEDRIVELQESKRKVVEGVLDEEGRGGVGRLGVRELGFLFGLNGQ